MRRSFEKSRRPSDPTIPTFSRNGYGEIITYSSKGHQMVNIGTGSFGEGLISTHSSTGQRMVTILANRNGGMIGTHSLKGEEQVLLMNNTVITHGEDGQGSVRMSGHSDGGFIDVKGSDGRTGIFIMGYGPETSGGIFVYNKTGEMVVQANTDEYGNGVVGAYNRKGVGRTLSPGPWRKTKPRSAQHRRGFDGLSFRPDYLMNRIS